MVPLLLAYLFLSLGIFAGGWALHMLIRLILGKVELNYWMCCGIVALGAASVSAFSTSDLAFQVVLN